MAVPFVREFDDLAETMATPNPNRPIENAIAGFGRKACDGISSNPELYAPTILQSPLVVACTPYWNSQGYSAPVLESPFQGGQCGGVIYAITATIKAVSPYTSVISQLTQTFNAVGPISAVVGQALATSSNCTPTGGATNSGGRNVTAVQMRLIVTGGAGITAAPLTNVASNWGPSTCEANLIRPSDVVTVEDISIVAVAGGANNCGDPAPVVRPGPTPAPDPGPLPPGTGPTINARGEVVLNLPENLEISPGLTLDLAPEEVNLGSGTGNSAPKEPLGADAEEGAGSAEGGGDNEFGEPPDGERWVGCCVNITTTPPGSGSIPQAEPQSIYPRTIGNVRLIFKAAEDLKDYDTPLTNRQKTTCVWESVRGQNPTGVRVNLIPGYSYTFRPYSVPLEQ